MKLGKSEILLKLTDKQVEAMGRKELGQVVTRLNDIANRRIQRMEKQNDLHSPALNYITRTGGLEGIRGKSLEEVREQYVRVRNFLMAKTGTVKGSRQYQKEAFKRTAAAIGLSTAELESKMSKTQRKRFWKVIDRAAEAGFISKSGKEFYRAREILSREIDEGDKRRGVDRLYEKVFGEGGSFNQLYEDEKAAELMSMNFEDEEEPWY